MMDVVEGLQTAITMVQEARPVPLSASCVIHRGELLAILRQAHEDFPEDLAQARDILENRDRILAEAVANAEQIMEAAKIEVSMLVENTEVVAAARREAQRIISEATIEAQREKGEIDSYIDARLATVEVILNKTLDVVQRGRDKLAGGDEKHSLSELMD